MSYRVIRWMLAAALCAPAGLAAQQAPSPLGTWEARVKPGKGDAQVHTVVIRADSSASYGKEIVRWRVRRDTILIALGGEWVSYRLRLVRNELTLSGGDLTEPITLRRVGPPTPRPAGVSVPPDPDTVEY